MAGRYLGACAQNAFLAEESILLHPGGMIGIFRDGNAWNSGVIEKTPSIAENRHYAFNLFSGEC